MKYLILLISILLFSATLSTGQSIQPIDENYAKIHKDELRFAASIYLDYFALRELRAKDLEKIQILERIINDKTELMKIRDEDVEMLKQQIIDISPAWYNKFSYGFVLGVLAAIITLLAVK